jgi:ribokinase
MRAAVVGHVEWVTFAQVPVFPSPGEIVAAAHTWEDAGGGGAVAAVELARLGAEVAFFTALGDDGPGELARARLAALGLELRVATRRRPQRRAFTLLDPSHERTIVILGPRLVPDSADPLGWADLDRFDAVYFTGGDAGALRHARRAKHLVATTRARDALQASDVLLDALVLSDRDPSEALDPSTLPRSPRATVSTLGADGGRWVAGTEEGTWATAPLPGPPQDAYGAGDCFAAGLTFGLGAGGTLAEAVRTGAASGAAAMTRAGPYESSVSSGA